MIKEGIINLLKPAGMTSHDGVQLLRRLTGIKRIGHTGTLDPMAVGVLPICIGSAARITEYLDLDYKKYRCEMQLGLETDTLDIWGNTLFDKRKEIKPVSQQDVVQALNTMKGEIYQIPPSYSAVRVNGKRLYEYAREGEEIKAKARKVYIKSINLVRMDLENHRITFDVECSKGTYIRTLCQDVGKLLGWGGTMSCLIRLQSGVFHLNNTVTIEQLLTLRIGEDIRDKDTGKYIQYARAEEEELNKLIYDPDYPLVHFGKAIVNNERANWFVNGGHLRMSDVRIEKEPAFNDLKDQLNMREEYLKAYNIYSDGPGTLEGQPMVFLGVAFYNKQYKKLVADKVFSRNN